MGWKLRKNAMRAKKRAEYDDILCYILPIPVPAWKERRKKKTCSPEKKEEMVRGSYPSSRVFVCERSL